MAKVKINGTEYTIDKFKFKSLKRSWPYMSKAKDADETNEQDMIAAIDAGISIVAIGLNKTEDQPPALRKLLDEMPDEDKGDIDKREVVCFNWIQEELDADETLGISNTVHQIMVEAGMIAAEPSPGEPGKEQPSLSTGTSTA